MKKLLLLAVVAGIAFAVYRVLVGDRQDHSVWSEYTDDVA